MHYRIPRPFKVGACVKARALGVEWAVEWALVVEWAEGEADNR